MLPDTKKLTRHQVKVTQDKETEAPFSGCYVKFEKEGDYQCIVCEEKLFNSQNKFDSGTGWPSFLAPAKKSVINEQEIDDGRVEVSCKACGAHLGHVFNDGPKPAGLRYCINSASLNFKAPPK